MPNYSILKKNKEFKLVFKKGKNIRSSSLYVRYISRDKLKPDFYAKNNSIFGITISKKISKKAVDRNLLKRRIKSIIQQNEKKNKNFVTVICPTKACLSIEFETLKKELDKIIKTIYW